MAHHRPEWITRPAEQARRWQLRGWTVHAEAETMRYGHNGALLSRKRHKMVILHRPLALEDEAAAAA